MTKRKLGKIYIERRRIARKWRTAAVECSKRDGAGTRVHALGVDTVSITYRTPAQASFAVFTTIPVEMSSRTDLGAAFDHHRMRLSSRGDRLPTPVKAIHRDEVILDPEQHRLIQEYTTTIFNLRASLDFESTRYAEDGRFPYFLAPLKASQKNADCDIKSRIDWAGMGRAIRLGQNADALHHRIAARFSAVVQGIDRFWLGEELRSMTHPLPQVEPSAMLEPVSVEASGRVQHLEPTEHSGDKQVEIVATIAGTVTAQAKGWETQPNNVDDENITTNASLASAGILTNIHHYVQTTPVEPNSHTWFWTGDASEPALQPYSLEGGVGYHLEKDDVADAVEAIVGHACKTWNRYDTPFIYAVMEKIGIDCGEALRENLRRSRFFEEGAFADITVPILPDNHPILFPSHLDTFQQAMGYKFKDIHKLRFAFMCWVGVGRDGKDKLSELRKSSQGRELKKCGDVLLRKLINGSIGERKPELVTPEDLTNAFHVWCSRESVRKAFETSALTTWLDGVRREEGMPELPNATTYRVFLFFIFGAILWDAGCRVNERVIIAYEGIFAIILETLEIQGEL